MRKKTKAVAAFALVVLLAGAGTAFADLEFTFDPETSGFWAAGSSQSIFIMVRSDFGSLLLGGYQIDFTYDFTATGASLTGIDTYTYISPTEMSVDLTDPTDDGAASVARFVSTFGTDTGLTVGTGWTTIAALEFQVGATPAYPVEIVVNLYGSFDISFNIIASSWVGALAFDGGSYNDSLVECTLDAHCNDGVACTDDQCNSFLCSNTTNDANCDDGAWCNGDETCDAVYDCQGGGARCPDDGLFCNGTESCDEPNDQCLHSGDPCNPGTEICNETTDSCDPVTDDDDDDDTTDDDDDDTTDDDDDDDTTDDDDDDDTTDDDDDDDTTGDDDDDVTTDDDDDDDTTDDDDAVPPADDDDTDDEEDVDWGEGDVSGGSDSCCG